MSLIVRLKRKMFAWGEHLANSYEYCLKHHMDDENAQKVKILNRKYPNETARIKERLSNDPNFTKNFKNYKATTSEGESLSKNLKNGLKDFDKDSKQLYKSIQKNKKLSKIANIGGGVAAAAGLGYGLKKSFDKKKDWEDEKSKISITSPSGKKLTKKEQEFYRGKETRGQKEDREHESKSILAATGLAGGALEWGKGIQGEINVNKLSDHHLSRLRKKRNFILNSNTKNIQDADFIKFKHLHDLHGKADISSAAAKRLKERVHRKASKNIMIGTGVGLAAGGALAAMYNMNKKVKNERENSKKRLKELQKR